MKTENIMVQEDGYLCLVDYGLSKILERNELAFSFVGCPEYIAPEILQEDGYSYPVDWWILGVLTYEMMTGFPPFYTGGSNKAKMYTLIMTRQHQYPDLLARYGIDMTDESRDFID